MKSPLIVAALILSAALPAAALTPAAPASLAAVVAGPQRSAANKARDAYRHPVETLTFFGLQPTMTVVEISPQGGWYTEILAPYLRERGKLYAAADNAALGPRAAAARAKFEARLAADPASFNKVEVSAFGKDAYAIAPDGGADMVLTFRNVHNWYIGGFAPDAFKAFYAALKPGGVLGIEEHRLPEDRPDKMQDSSGYMKTSTVIKLAEAAGFKLVAKSEINANPKDKADYPDGVWTLPPVYTRGAVDRARYAAIGESDRMTLKFVK